MEFVPVLYSKRRGVQYASPGKWPSPKHPGNVGRVKAGSPPLYRVVNVKQCNMWDRPDEHNPKPGDNKDDTIVVFPPSAAGENGPKCTTAVVDDSRTDFCNKATNDHWIDCKTSSQGDTKAEHAPRCSTTRKLPNSILASLGRQPLLSVDSGLSGDTAINSGVRTNRETDDSGGGSTQLNTDAVNGLLISEVVNEDSQHCALMENDSSETVVSGGHPAVSQQCHPQEHESVVENASSETCECFIPLSPPTETPEAVPAQNCSMCGRPCLLSALHESFSATAAVAQSSSTPSQAHQSMTDGARLQSNSPTSSQSSPDAPTWISPLLIACNLPELLVFTDTSKQHKLVKGMMAEVCMQMCTCMRLI